MLYPLILEPILAAKPWGGDRLAAYGKAVVAGDRIGESWEVADLDLDADGTVPYGKSQVTNGPLAGETLGGLMTEHGKDLLGFTPGATPFPLLIKLLDAREPLSVQVHPTSDYVAHHPDTHVKAESWYIVEAEPGAFIYKGFKPGTAPSDIARTAGTPKIVDYLQTVPVRPGDIYHLPAGTVHALGAGVLVAEVQTPSDTTFRIYDWTDELNRPPRRLEIAEALACLDYSDPPQTDPIELGPTVRSLIHTDHYWIHEHRSPIGTLDVDATPGLRVFMVLGGTVAIGAVNAGIGSAVVVPASTPSVVRAETTAIVLEIGLAG